MAKIEVPLERAHRLLTPAGVLLVTCVRKDRVNVAPVSWVVPIGLRPPLVAMAVQPHSFTYELIRASSEFVLNIASPELARQVHFCGNVSGRDVDKLAVTGLHVAEPSAVRAPLIEECIGHLECAVVDVLTPGDHAVFLAEVVAASADSEAFDDTWKLTEKEIKLLHHLGGSQYAVLGDRFQVHS